MASEQVLSLRELKPDPANPRRRGERARSLLRRSLQEFGAARSIVVDEAGNIIAGHGTVEAAGEAGITRVRVVDADGSELIAVRRAGLTEEQKARLGLLDNQTGALAEWGPEIVAELADNAELVAGIWTEDELEALLAAIEPPEFEPGLGLPEGDRPPFEQMTFTLHVSQADVVREALLQAKHAGPFTGENENSNGNALHRIAEAYLRKEA